MKNKSLLLTLAFLAIVMNLMAQKTGTFTDSRDGKKYKKVEIGTQIWMAENIAYKAGNGCWAYNNDVNNIAKFGYLYNWETAKIVCPAGWHLPTHEEWIELVSFLVDENVVGAKLKSINGWDSPDNGATNETGFTALPGGYYDKSGTFDLIGTSGIWWTSTEISGERNNLRQVHGKQLQ